ncbi:MAG: hypothetical protein EOO88_63035 [Pedobacter sp.]|nr:MAG: hypothetical protein EOO88_63035 [Pedobacter sp.]
MDIDTNLVLRPIDGCVVTLSGRRIPQPPWILPGDQESAIAYQAWLAEQARAEAAESGYDWILSQLDNLRPDSMDEGTRQLLSDFLFGQLNPVFEARRSSI